MSLSKILLSTPILFIIVSYAPAAYALNPIEPNCDNVKVSFGSDYSFGGFQPKVIWEKVGTFPTPTETIEVGGGIDSKNTGFSFKCPDFSVSYDNKVLEIKGKSYDKVLELIKKSDSKYVDENKRIDYDLNLYSHSWYDYPSIRRGLNTISYGLSLKNMDLKKSRAIAYEGQKLPYQFSGVSKDVVIAYKVDGKELKPLLFEKNVSSYKTDLENANQIDIYHKNNDMQKKGRGVQRVLIDKRAGILKVYKNYEFPLK